MALIKVRQVVKLSGWTNGSGWSYKDQVYDDQIVDIAAEDLEAMDWDWWETDEDYPPSEDSDTQITVEFYAEDADPDEDKPLASHNAWVSELYKERYSADENSSPVLEWTEQGDDYEVYDVAGKKVKVSWGWATGSESGCHNEYDSEILVEVDGENYTGFDVDAEGEAWDPEYLKEYEKMLVKVFAEIKSSN